MLIPKKAAGGLAVALGATLALTACGSSKSGAKVGNGSGSSVSAVGAGDPHTGGVLRIVGEDDNSNYDPNGAYDTNSYSLISTYARQLYTNKPSENAADRTDVIPDLADGMPTISADGKTYTVKLKSGIKWSDGSAVTAADVVRGLKALCNPVDVSTSPASYLPQTVVGMSDYCDGFGKVDANSASAIAAYNEKVVSGITASDDSTVVFTLLKPASDFLHILTLPAMSARPASANKYVPESPAFRQHLYSDGPYEVSAYTPDKSITLVRNPNWVASTDTVRKAYVDSMQVTLGLTQESIQQEIQSGQADMALGNEAPPTTSIATLRAQGSKQLVLNPTGGINPYIIFNFVGPAGSPVQKVAVRQALEYAVNKTAVAQVLGGDAIAQPFGQIFPQGVVGKGWQKLDPYATPNSAGDAAKAKSMLAAAGYPNGFSLKFAYRTTGNGPKIYATLVSAFAAAGVKVIGVPVAGKQYYSSFLPTLSNAKSGAWDIAEPGWGPDWEGASERSFYGPLLDSRSVGNQDYGRYSSDKINAEADAALAETDETKSAADWTQVDKDLMADAPWIPLIQNVQANYFGSRVRNFEWSFVSNQGYYANVAVQ